MDLPSLWPSSGQGSSTLICCRVESRVESLFRSLWIEKDLLVCKAHVFLPNCGRKLTR
jgi:hypothetical protein